MAFGGHKEDSTHSKDGRRRDHRGGLDRNLTGNLHGEHETVTERVLRSPSAALLIGVGTQREVGTGLDAAKARPNGSQIRKIRGEMIEVKARRSASAEQDEMTMNLGGHHVPHRLTETVSKALAIQVAGIQGEAKRVMDQIAESAELLNLVKKLGQTPMRVDVEAIRPRTLSGQNTAANRWNQSKQRT